MLALALLLGACIAAPLDGNAPDLPGFINILRNDSSPSTVTPADAAFGSECRYLTLGGYGRKGQTTLEATCKDDQGRWWQTSLNLNDCIGNNGGRLVYGESGDFDDSCRPCIIDPIKAGGDVLLKCNCLDKPGGVPRYTSLQFGLLANDERAVKPKNGRLVCGKHKGSKSPYYAQK